MAAKPRNRFLDYGVYLLCRFVSMLFHCFPIELNIGSARLLGTLLYRVDKKHRKRAMHNLKRSFPDLTEAQCRTLARQSMQNMVMLAVEVMFTTTLIRLETWRKHVELENFSEVLELLLRQKTGMIMLTGHYGNWEVLGYLLATLGFETTSIARPLDNPYVNHWILGVREKQGQRIVAKKGATEEILPVLDAKGAVGFIADQNAGTKGIFVDFFGRKASTYKSIGLLAMEYNVPVVIGYARRTGGAFQFAVGAQDVIYPADWASQEKPLEYITQRYTKAIEEIVRKEPSQYLWLHRRWKSRPKGEAPEQYD
jgi:Kdo2-lipid IVA lauroyltransferase/acyltransferase